jgi:RNA polymerase sigma factor (sigma-70 family)
MVPREGLPVRPEQTWPEQILRAWPVVFQGLYNRLRRWRIQREEAEDLADEATLRAAERARSQSFADDRHAENWMYRVAERHAIDQLRRSNRLRSEPLAEEFLPAPGREPPGWEEVVRRCAEHLTPRQMLLLSMRYRDERTWQELADLLLPPDNRSVNGRISAVRREWEEALRQIRRYLEEEGMDPDRW